MEIKEIERAILKRYRAKIFRPFTRALQEYKLIEDHDRIAVCISGGKDSFTLAKLMQEIQRHGKQPFELKFLVMDPGYSQENIEKLKENAAILGIPIQIRKSNVFQIAQKLGKESPCYFCASMRRGFLYQFAKDEGCNKIALGHHFDDVIETTLMNIFYAGSFKTMVPKLKAENFQAMELIRPMVFVKEKDIQNFMNYIEMYPMSCGCEVERKQFNSKRREMKQLIAGLKKNFKDVDKCIYKSAENVNLDRVLGYKQKGKEYKYIDYYQELTSEES